MTLFPWAMILMIQDAIQCSNDVEIVTRSQWHARVPRKIDNMSTPVDIVFIHHSAMNRCFNLSGCIREVQKIQNFHMDTRGWFDIGYNFLVGEDGRVYEGRGWDREGAHTKHFNRVAVAVCVMGDFSHTLPDSPALNAVKWIINRGVCLGKVAPNYRLYGHRDVRDTTCPGETFYQYIQTWQHYSHVKPTPDSIVG